MRELREQAEKNDGSAEYARSELRTYKKKVEDLTAQLDRLRGQVRGGLVDTNITSDENT